MTAEEKAHELLFTTFRKAIGVNKYFFRHNPYHTFRAKRCALACVELLIEFDAPRYKYWNEVKEEIKKL